MNQSNPHQNNILVVDDIPKNLVGLTQILTKQGYLVRPAINGQVALKAIYKAFTDTGEGIPNDIKERIFEPFFTTKPTGEGSGLGSDIVRKIIDKHQGRIEVESQPGKTTFSAWLPDLSTTLGGSE